MSLSGWIYQGTGWGEISGKVAAHGIDTVYVDPRSQNAPQVVADAGLRAAVYVVAGWPQVPVDAPQAAVWVSDQLERLIPRGERPRALPAMVEFEGTTPSWQAAFLHEYRKYQPRRPSSAAVGALQGGNVAAGAFMVAGFDLYVETYYGDTLPDGRLRPADAAACVLEQARAADPHRVHPFYDGAALPADHRDGCVFTIERLP